MTVTRRRLLKGLGGISLALPWLEALTPRSAWGQVATSPKRVIAVTYCMGVPQPQWRPHA